MLVEGCSSASSAVNSFGTSPFHPYAYTRLAECLCLPTAVPMPCQASNETWSPLIEIRRMSGRVVALWVTLFFLSSHAVFVFLGIAIIDLFYTI